VSEYVVLAGAAGFIAGGLLVQFLYHRIIREYRELAVDLVAALTRSADNWSAMAEGVVAAVERLPTPPSAQNSGELGEGK
jgi:hypothetical protein